MTQPDPFSMNVSRHIWERAALCFAPNAVTGAILCQSLADAQVQCCSLERETN